jgi:hypothetical protein
MFLNELMPGISAPYKAGQQAARVIEPAPSVTRAALFISLKACRSYFERDRVSSWPSTRRLLVTPNAPGTEFA